MVKVRPDRRIGVTKEDVFVGDGELVLGVQRILRRPVLLSSARASSFQNKRVPSHVKRLPHDLPDL